MDFRLLGPLQVVDDDGHELPVAAGRQRALLACLLFRPNEPISSERLVEELWGEHAPPTAHQILLNQVSALRRTLGRNGRLETKGSAYCLHLSDGERDIDRFEELFARGRSLLELDPEGAAAALRKALALWRGPALSDLAYEPFAQTEIARLEERRLAASDELVEAELALGGHVDLVAELESAVERHPLRERLYGQLMLALYRCGRQAEALQVYMRARETLVEEIGVEPGPELRARQAAILAQDPALERPEDEQELPPALAAGSPFLAGRARELARLQERLTQAGAGRGGLVLVSGARGMGKTRLAAELARVVLRARMAVAYAGPAVPPDEALAAVRRVASLERPSLLVLDDAGDASPSVLAAVAEVAREAPARGLLVLALHREPDPPPALGGLSAEQLALGPLADDAVAEIAQLYLPSTSAAVAARAIVAESAGVPLEAHRAASRWAEAEAAERLVDTAARAETERSDMRVAQAELAGNVIDLQAVRRRGSRYTLEDIEAPDGEVPATCPFLGLATFEAAHAEYFFGRERLVADLVARLVGSQLLAVVGPSGSGKSSAVRAGLLPALAEGALPGSERWRQVLMRPGGHPLLELEAALRRAVPEIDAELRGPVEFVAALPPNVHLLLAVDQFEEVFAACRDEDERTGFIDALVAAARDRDKRVAVALALRADFYGRCAAHEQLAELVGANQVLVGPMRRDELRRAIELPARRVGLRVEPTLVDALIADVHDKPGGLPLLSTALLELWRERDGRVLRRSAYARTGGVRGAVARLAEDTYARLGGPQQQAARRIVLRLTDAGDEAAFVRRRVPLEELELERDEHAAAALVTLTESRLVTVDKGGVEVAHEALLREWPRLRAWLEEDAEGRRLHQHLIHAARDWQTGGRDPGELYRGARLASTLEWATHHGSELNELERDFLAESRAEAELEAEHQRRVNRRLRALLAGVGALLVLALLAGIVALEQRGTARREALGAQAQRLGAQALSEDDLDRSLLLARQGVELEDSLETRSNLLAALLRSPAAIGVVRSEGNRLLQLALRPDGRALVVGDNHGNVLFLDPLSRRPLRRPYRALRLSEVDNTWHGVPIVDLGFSPDGSVLAIRSAGGVQLLDGRTWRRVAALKVPDAESSNALPDARDPSVAFTPNGRTLLVPYTLTLRGDVPTTVIRFDVRTGRQLGRPVQLAPSGLTADILAFRPDGRRFVTAENRVTVIRDTRTLRPIRTVPGGHDFGSALAFALSPDGRTLAAGGEDGSLRFLDLRTGGERVASGRHQGAVQGAVFTRDGRSLMTVGDDANAIVWDVGAGTAAETLQGHAGRVLAVTVDRSARTLFTAGLDGSVISWDLAGDRRLGRPFDAGPGVGVGEGYPSTALSRDGRTLVTTQAGGAISVIDTATMTRRSVGITSGRSPLYAPAFGPRGTLVVAGFDGTLAVVNARTGKTIAPLRGHRDVVFTPTTSADGSIVASTGLDHTLRLWDARSGRPLGPPTKLDSPPFSDAGVSPDGRSVAVSLERGTIDVFEVRSRRRLARLRVDEGIPMHARFSRDGRFLLGGSRDGRVRVFSSADWRPLGPAFQAHAGFVSSVDASPDGRTLVTAGTDGQVRLWDLGTRRPIGSALPGPENINAVAFFAPDGSHVFAIFADGRGYRWDVRPSSWRRQACQVAGRRLSQSEWDDALPGHAYAPAC